MVSLGYDGVLVLLGYGASSPHPLEILGYEYSRRGAEQFRRERPDYTDQAVAVVAATLKEYGAFPREISDELRRSGTYVVKTRGRYVLHHWIEVSVCAMKRGEQRFLSVGGAARALVRERGNADYLPGLRS